MEYGGGIRILRQDKLEMFISFIISANNNIKRIQNSIKKLSEKFGTKINSKQFGDYYAFPTLEQLNKNNRTRFFRCRRWLSRCATSKVYKTTKRN